MPNESFQPFLKLTEENYKKSLSKRPARTNLRIYCPENCGNLMENEELNKVVCLKSYPVPCEGYGIVYEIENPMIVLKKVEK